jgi:hypothetical protein
MLKCKTITILILMHQMRIPTNFKVSSVIFRPKKLEIRINCENCKRAEKTKGAINLSQIRRRIELCMREIILRFEMNLFSSLAHWAESSSELFWLLVIRRLSVKHLYFRLLQNRWANFNQTWHKSSLGKGDSELYKWRTTPFHKGR